MDINKLIDTHNLDGILVTSMINIRYLSNFKGSEAIVLTKKDSKYILVDSRYYEMALEQCSDFNVVLVERNSINKTLNAIIIQEKVKKLGFEADRLVVKKYVEYSRELQTHLVGLSLDKIRMIKNDDEIKKIRKACEITDLAYKHILNYIKVGMSEIEVNRELQRFILLNGASDFSFTTIVASGTRGSMPHGIASNKLIEENDFVTLDFGVFYEGYASDMTRTFVIGKSINKQLESIYNIVLGAQLKAIESIKPGIKASEVDKVARDYINEFGYSQYFTHGLGHSFGLEIHEPPYLNKVDQTVLEKGMIITVEPGIYIPELGGIRIEDDVLVTENGCEVLNKSTKDLIKIG